MLNVYELKWNGPSTYDDIGNGLWINNSKIAIHLPIFEKEFNIIKEYKEYKLETLAENFYIEYYNDDSIERMDFLYFALNDLVFNNNVYNRSKKNKFYTTLKLK